MPFRKRTKYIYSIRCSNGAAVENLQIYGQTEAIARDRLMQMYHNCEVLNVAVAATTRQVSSDYVDVLSNIIESH